MRLFEWHSTSFAEHKKKLPDLVSYLSGVWQNRNRYIELSEDLSEEEAQEQKIHNQRFFDFTVDNKISARNYVGVVQFEDIRIEVYPKLFADDETENVSKWQLNIMYWLTYCRKIKFPYSFANVSKFKFDTFLELLIYVFANYSLEILSHQPYQSYQHVEEETTYLKGRLSFDNYTKNNLSTGKWQNFYCIYEPFVYDNLLNRIIKYVTRRLLSISDNYLNKEKLNEILFLLHDVSDVRCIAEDCDKVNLNPLYEDHRHILELCKLYLSNQVIDMDSEDSRNFCFLVPMEYIFEDFIFGFISNNWSHLKPKSQCKEYLALSEGKQVFEIRNDIFIKDILIIDTKYKIRLTGNGIKAGVNQNDLYQVISYAITRNCKNVLLLYPQTISSENKPSLFTINSELIKTQLNIEVKNIDISFDDIHLADEIIKSRVSQLSSLFLNQS